MHHETKFALFFRNAGFQFCEVRVNGPAELSRRAPRFLSHTRRPSFSFSRRYGTDCMGQLSQSLLCTRTCNVGEVNLKSSLEVTLFAFGLFIRDNDGLFIR
jgi:hypothetical protein